MLSDTVYLTDTICSGKSYFVGNFTYSTTGIFQSLLIASDGSDSIVILNLTVLPPIQNNISDTICSGQSYYVGNFTYSATGFYQGVLVAPDGCDSIVNLNLTVLPPIQNNITANICSGQSYYVGNFTYSTTGLYQAILITPGGCDSIVNLDLTVLPTFQQSLTATICSGQVFQVGDTAYTNSGVYQTTLAATNGCDSVVTLNLTVLPPIQQALSATICSGQSYTLGASVFTQSGQYQEDLTTPDGCDSIVTLNLTVLPPIQQEIAATICNGQSFQIGDSTYSDSGVFQTTLTASNSCDSIVTLNLTVLPPIQQEIAATICNGQSFQVGDTTYIDSGVFQTTLTASNGCDSIVNLNLTVLPPIQSAVTATICNGQSFQVGDTTYIDSGVFQTTLTASNGCDSVVNLDLTVLPPILSAVTATICDGQSFQVGDSTYSENGVYQNILVTSNGCDSIINLTLTVEAGFFVSPETTSPQCPGQTGTLTIGVDGGTAPYQFAMEAGSLQDQASFSGLMPGIYSVVVQDSNGCTAVATAVIEPAPVLTLGFSETEITMESGDSVLLQPLANFTVDSFFWVSAAGLDCPDCWQPLVQPAQSTLYQLFAYSAAGCELTATTQVKVTIVRRVFIPNAFKPDSDGLNDTFTLYADEQVEQILRMHIYDRWGDEIFGAGKLAPNGLETGWDGRYRGQDLMPGVYTYFIEVQYVDGTTELFMGDVTLVR